MTVDLSDEAPDDAEELIIAWLAPLHRSAAERDPVNDPLPFDLVTHIAGDENTDTSTAAPIVQVGTLCDKRLGRAAAKVECGKTHRRMLRLARHIDDIVLTDGRVANVDYVIVNESPRWMPYGDDQILQKIGRYEIGLTFVAVS